MNDKFKEKMKGLYMIYFDRYYLVLIIPAMIIAVLAQINVKSTFAKYSSKMSSRGLTGFDVARRILDSNGLGHIRIEQVAGNLTDHYDPKANVIRLSSSVYAQSSVAAIGVAAHEAGHAVQYSVSYAPIKIRAALIPVTQIGSSLALPIAFVGIFMGMDIFVNIGIVLFSAVVLFQLITLPVEFNASSRAIKTIEEHAILDISEIGGAKKVLGAAALTYVAALISSLASLLRLILLARRNDRN